MSLLQNEEDVAKVAKKLEKMSKNDTVDAAAVTEQLKLLKSFKMTIDTLQRTRIGLIINAVRKKTADQECSQIARGLIKAWKKLLPTSGAEGDADEDGQGQVEGTNGDHGDSMHGDEKRSTSSDSRQNGKSGVLSKQNSTSSNSGASSQHDPTRAKCENLILDALKSGIAEDDKDGTFTNVDDEKLASLAAELENAIFSDIRKTDDRYKNRIRSRVMNLRDKKNRQLRQAYVEGAITPDQLAKMSPEEMASDEMKKLREKFTKESINDAQMAFSGGTSTTHIKCSKCGKSDVTYNQVQTRSADEPMTTFCLCNNCGRRWKFC